MPKASAKPKDDTAAQSARFIEAARELGCDESPEAFEAAVKKVGRQKAQAHTDTTEVSEGISASKRDRVRK